LDPIATSLQSASLDSLKKVDERMRTAYVQSYPEPGLDAAEPWIVRAADERSPWVGYLRIDPRVAALHDRPGIKAIMAHLGQGA